jgi:hypothetical protein
MTGRRLLNADALFALVLGLVLLLNGLLGPRFAFGPVPAALIGLVALVAAVLLGQGGMGRGPLTERLRLVGLAHIITAAVLVGAAAPGRHGAARSFALVVAAFNVVMGAAQVRTRRSGHELPVHGRRRASAEELRAAIGRDPNPDDPRGGGST